MLPGVRRGAVRARCPHARAGRGTRAGSVQPGDDRPSGARADPLSGVPDPVYRLDEHGRFAYLNAAAERLLEHRAEELLGRDAREAFPGLRRSLAEDQFQQVLEDGRPREFQFLYEPRGRWYEVRIFPDQGGAAVLFRDVDVRRRHDEERDAQVRQLTAVLEALPSPTVLVDRDGRILATNGAWVRSAAALPDVVLPGLAGEDYLMVMQRGLDAATHGEIYESTDDGKTWRLFYAERGSA